MELRQLYDSIEDVATWSQPDVVCLFVWWLHKVGKLRVSASEVGQCFDELHLERPSGLHTVISRLSQSKPKRLLKDRTGIYLAKSVFDELDRRLLARQTTVTVHKLLAELPATLPTIEEREFLDEAVKCLKCEAYRAAIVMTWNLAYDHLCVFILSGKLSDFNTHLGKAFPKRFRRPISCRSDFETWKEAEVLQVAQASGNITSTVRKVMLEKLMKRNLAAHPSSATFTMPQAEEFVLDLVNNAVLLMK